MGTLLCSCVKVRKEIEQPFGVLNGLGPDIGLLDEGPHTSRRRGGKVYDAGLLVWDFPLGSRQRNVLSSYEKN